MAASDAAGIPKVGQTVAQDLAELGSHASEIARERYDQVKANAAEMVEDGRERVQEMEQNLELYIAENPIKSMLIAAGIGLLVGRCILR